MQNESFTLQHCDLCQPIVKDETEFGTSLIASQSDWPHLLNEKGLPYFPQFGCNYEVKLFSPVSFVFNESLWLLYQTPSTFINGFDTSENINTSCFVKGKITSIIHHTEKEVLVNFMVEESIALADILTAFPPQPIPTFWEEQLVDGLENDEYNFYRFDDYAFLVTSIDGDIGVSCLLKKTKEGYSIFLVNEFSFHENNFFGANYIAPASIIAMLNEQ